MAMTLQAHLEMFIDIINGSFCVEDKRCLVFHGLIIF